VSAFRLAALFDLAGRTAVVTGGNSGIGLAMARALGLAGARVVLLARREAELREAAERLRGEGIDAVAVAADLAKPETGSVVASACERLGPRHRHPGQRGGRQSSPTFR
jgi:gluconate 5-dehydrogenase